MYFSSLLLHSTSPHNPMTETNGGQKRRRRSRYIFSEIPDLTHGLTARRDGALLATRDATFSCARAPEPSTSRASLSNSPHLSVRIRSSARALVDLPELRDNGCTEVFQANNTARCGVEDVMQFDLLREVVMTAQPVAETNSRRFYPRTVASARFGRRDPHCGRHRCARRRDSQDFELESSLGFAADKWKP